jgi:hypothetical protein
MSYDYADSVLDQHVINLLCAKNNQLREALKFYADEKNYQPREWLGESLVGWHRESVVNSDNGKIARAALVKEKR